jgi:hypothetical protein
MAKGTVGGVEAADRWKRGESGAKQLIAATVPETTYSQIKSGTCTKDVWDDLKKLHEERSRITQVTLLRKFRNQKCEEGENVCTHFEELSYMRKQLAAMGKSIDKDDYINILLALLPPSYQPAISAINASTHLGKGTIKSEDIIQLMTDEYKRLPQNNKFKSNSQDKAFTADSKRKECTNCNCRGHVQKECWARGGGQEGGGPKRGQGRGKERAAAAYNSTDIEAWVAITEIQWEGEDREDQQTAHAPPKASRANSTTQAHRATCPPSATNS